MKIQLAFYKSNKNLSNKIIRFWTNSIYSHVEIILGEAETGDWISATSETQTIEKRKINYNKKNWDIIDISFSHLYNKETILKKFKLIEHSKYDWLAIIFSVGIFKNFKKCIIEDKNKFICSEACAFLLNIENSCKFNPGDLAEWVGLKR